MSVAVQARDIRISTLARSGVEMRSLLEGVFSSEHSRLLLVLRPHRARVPGVLSFTMAAASQGIFSPVAELLHRVHRS